MKETSVQPFLLPAAVVIAALLIGGAVYMNSPNRKSAQGLPTPSVTGTPTPLSTTTVIVTTSTPTVTPKPTTIKPTVSDSELLRLAVLAKSGIPSSKFEYSVGKNLGTMATGSVRNKDDMGGAAWFAGKVNGVWKISYIGQGVPLCSALGTIPYPTTWLSHCMDAKGNTVAR